MGICQMSLPTKKWGEILWKIAIQKDKNLIIMMLMKNNKSIDNNRNDGKDIITVIKRNYEKKSLFFGICVLL